MVATVPRSWPDGLDPPCELWYPAQIRYHPRLVATS